ncbi:MAG: hypothetical protein LAO51_14620 [Acidobacteriia bacterium]|nr:hypothetical protein [Terriglobia bacterium]
MSSDTHANLTARRESIRTDLEAGASHVFLIRSFKKYPWLIGALFVGWAVVWLVSLSLLFSTWRGVVTGTQAWIARTVNAATPAWLGSAIDWLLNQAHLPSREQLIAGLSGIAGAAALAAAAGYLLSFPLYSLARRRVIAADQRAYHRIAGTDPESKWNPVDPDHLSDIPPELPLEGGPRPRRG